VNDASGINARIATQFETDRYPCCAAVREVGCAQFAGRFNRLNPDQGRAMEVLIGLTLISRCAQGIKK